MVHNILQDTNTTKAQVVPHNSDKDKNGVVITSMEKDVPVKMVTDCEGLGQPSLDEKGKGISYRDSLLGLGYNGVANGSQGMEEDELSSDLLNTSLAVPQTPKEQQDLIHLYPMVPNQTGGI